MYYYLATIYDKEKYGKQDLNKAENLYKRAAEKKNKESIFQLAELYSKGINGKKNFPQSFYWYKESATHKNPIAMYKLGVMYQKGIGVSVDKQIAYSCFLRASEYNHIESKYLLGLLYISEVGDIKDSPKMIEGVQHFAQKGDIKCYYYLAKTYEDKKDYEQSIRYYKLLASNNNYNALARLGMFYEKGWGVKQDFAKAYQYYYNAAQNNSYDGMFYIADMYFNGLVVAKDLAKSIELHHKAALLGCKKSQKLLSQYMGMGLMTFIEQTKKNHNDISRFWSAMIDTNQESKSLTFLAQTFLEGEIVPKDIEKGVIL